MKLFEPSPRYTRFGKLLDEGMFPETAAAVRSRYVSSVRFHDAGILGYPGLHEAVPPRCNDCRAERSDRKSRQLIERMPKALPGASRKLVLQTYCKCCLKR